MAATLADREELYRQAAHHIIDTDDKSQEQLADEIVKILEEQ